jgi:hypothetical protein
MFCPDNYADLESEEEEVEEEKCNFIRVSSSKEGTSKSTVDGQNTAFVIFEGFLRMKGKNFNFDANYLSYEGAKNQEVIYMNFN